MPLTEAELSYVEARVKAGASIGEANTGLVDNLQEQEKSIEAMLYGHATSDRRRIDGLKQKIAALKGGHYDYKSRRWDTLANRREAGRLIRRGYELQLRIDKLRKERGLSPAAKTWEEESP